MGHRNWSRVRALCCVVMMLIVTKAQAHVGSPDTFVQTNVGPYAVLVAAHPPAVFPGHD